MASRRTPPIRQDAASDTEQKGSYRLPVDLVQATPRHRKHVGCSFVAVGPADSACVIGEHLVIVSLVESRELCLCAFGFHPTPSIDGVTYGLARCERFLTDVRNRRRADNLNMNREVPVCSIGEIDRRVGDDPPIGHAVVHSPDQRRAPGPRYLIRSRRRRLSGVGRWLPDLPVEPSR